MSIAAHACGQKGLVPVAHGGVGDQTVVAAPSSSRRRLAGPFAQADCACPFAVSRRWAGRFGIFDLRGAGGLGFGVPVHGNVRDVGQHFCAAVAALGELEQVRRLVDELGVVCRCRGTSGA